MPRSTGEPQDPGGIRDGLTRRVRSAKKATSEKTRSARDAALDGVAAVGDSKAVGVIRSTEGTVAEGTSGAASRGSVMVRSAAARGKNVVGGGLHSAKGRILWETVLPDDALETLQSAVES